MIVCCNGYIMMGDVVLVCGCGVCLLCLCWACP